MTAATVTGVVSLPPPGTTAPMLVTRIGNIYTAAYTIAAAGRHSYELTASGAGIGAVQGTFVARRDLLGLAPITVDPTVDVGYIRLLVTDLDEVEPLFEDAQIAAFLAREGTVTLAAAAALETIARSELLVGKKITTQDLSTDGPAVAKELRESAKALRAQAAADAATDAETDDGYGLDVVDFDPWSAYRAV